MTKAIGYVRRSTDRQEESLDQQRTRLAEFDIHRHEVHVCDALARQQSVQRDRRNASNIDRTFVGLGEIPVAGRTKWPVRRDIECLDGIGCVGHEQREEPGARPQSCVLACELRLCVDSDPTPIQRGFQKIGVVPLPGVGSTDIEEYATTPVLKVVADHPLFGIPRVSRPIAPL